MDSDEPKEIVTLDIVCKVLDRFLVGELNAEKLQAWAERREVTDDVDCDSSDRDVISDVIFRLATPEINDPLNVDTVARMRADLGTRS